MKSGFRESEKTFASRIVSPLTTVHISISPHGKRSEMMFEKSYFFPKSQSSAEKNFWFSEILLSMLSIEPEEVQPPFPVSRRTDCPPRESVSEKILKPYSSLKAVRRASFILSGVIEELNSDRFAVLEATESTPFETSFSRFTFSTFPRINESTSIIMVP